MVFVTTHSGLLRVQGTHCSLPVRSDRSSTIKDCNAPSVEKLESQDGHAHVVSRRAEPEPGGDGKGLRTLCHALTQRCR